MAPSLECGIVNALGKDRDVQPSALSLGLCKLVSAHCTWNQAQSLFAEGAITKRQLRRYVRLWENSTFRTHSRTQDALFAIGGQTALERRYTRSLRLHVAWRKKVLALMARDCLAKLRE